MAPACSCYCTNCIITMDSPAFYPPNPLWKYPEVCCSRAVLPPLRCAYMCSCLPVPPLALTLCLQLNSVSLSNNSFGRIHLVAEMFDIVLRGNYHVHTLWCNNNVFTGLQTRQRFVVLDAKTPEEERYERSTLNAARSKLQAAVHVYVNEHIKPKSRRVKVLPDAGRAPAPCSIRFLS